MTGKRRIPAEKLRRLLEEGRRLRKEIERRLRPLKNISAKARSLILR